MPEIRRIEIRCTHCAQWMPSPIQMDWSESFDSSIIESNRMQCFHCGRITGCNKENMRWSRMDGNGGWVGIDTTGK